MSREMAETASGYLTFQRAVAAAAKRNEAEAGLDRLGRRSGSNRLTLYVGRSRTHARYSDIF